MRQVLRLMQTLHSNPIVVTGRIIALLSLPCVTLADEVSYTAKGHAIYRSLQAGHVFSYDFILSVSNKSWGIESEGGSPSRFKCRQICDGSNLVAITYWNYDQVRQVQSEQDGVVTVDSRTLPLDNPPVAHAIFVGFAAQLYLPPGTNGLLCPLWQDRELSRVAFVRSDWDRILPGGSLAETIRCWCEPQKWMEALHQTSMPARHQASIAALHRVIDKSRTNEESGKELIATYHTYGRSSLAGKLFPTACVFTAFAPDRTDGKDKALPVYEILVTNVVLRATADAAFFDPRFKGIAVVEDYRGGQRPSRTYTITNSAPLLGSP